MNRIPPQELRRYRDQVLRYVYEHGAGQPYFQVDGRQVERESGVPAGGFSQVLMLMHSQRLLADQGSVNSIGLSEAGQAEAEALGPSVLMRESKTSGNVHVHANQSIVQIAGSGSTLNANLSIDASKINTVLNQIEVALPSLPLTDAQRAEAGEQVKSLRAGIAAKIGDAGLRAIGGALGSILVGAGSPLGQSLLELLGVALT